MKKTRRQTRKVPIARKAQKPAVSQPAPQGGEVVLYRTADGHIDLNVRLQHETLWLTQFQMAKLFGRERSVLTKHLRNVFSEGELQRKAVCANFAHTAADGKTYLVEHYNLDAILSVGYRVNSRQGTRFRIWATRTLRDHLLRGYTLNEQRLRERGFAEAEQAIELLSKTLRNQSLVKPEGRAVLDVVQHYTRTWRLLLQYDEDRLPASPAQPGVPSAEITLAEARTAIDDLRGALVERDESTELFGRERAEQLAGILGAIEQTFGGEPLYPTVQARAAHLLYFIIKDHPFSDGNKRIGTLLFLEYLRRNHHLLGPDGQPLLADHAVVALALLVAESDPKQKDLMIRLILNLLPAAT